MNAGGGAGICTDTAPLAAARAVFEAISLDELVDQAELMRRVDRKYLLPIGEAAAAMAGIDPRARVLEIGGRRDFAYDSVYFDTDDHLAYRLTAQKRRRRFKLRTRSYLDTGGCFLEVKTKNGRGATVKRRIEYDERDRGRLTVCGRDYVRRQLCAEGHDPALVGRFRPSLVSRYRRTTLLLPEGTRATFDTRLSWGQAERRPSSKRHRLDLEGWVILETKSVGGTSQLDRLLWRTGRRPLGISKFGTGTAALHPELSSNKWARVLRGPFHLDHHHRAITTEEHS